MGREFPPSGVSFSEVNPEDTGGLSHALTHPEHTPIEASYTTLPRTPGFLPLLGHWRLRGDLLPLFPGCIWPLQRACYSSFHFLEEANRGEDPPPPPRGLAWCSSSTSVSQQRVPGHCRDLNCTCSRAAAPSLPASQANPPPSLQHHRHAATLG